MKKLLRSGYLENHSGTSYKFYQPAVWRDGDEYHVESCYGRIGTAGQTAPKYRGPDAASALAAFDRLVSEKLKGGYREADHTRANTRFLVERGAQAWDFEPRLQSLRAINQLDPAQFTLIALAGDYRLEGLSEDDVAHLAVLADADGVRRDGYHLDQPGTARIPRTVQDLLAAAHTAGYAPLTLEIAVGRQGVTLIDVWELRGQDLSELPGAERILLREQIAALDPNGSIGLPDPKATPRFAIDLASGSRAQLIEAVAP